MTTVQCNRRALSMKVCKHFDKWKHTCKPSVICHSYHSYDFLGEGYENKTHNVSGAENARNHNLGCFKLLIMKVLLIMHIYTPGL